MKRTELIYAILECITEQGLDGDIVLPKFEVNDTKYKTPCLKKNRYSEIEFHNEGKNYGSIKNLTNEVLTKIYKNIK